MSGGEPAANPSGHAKPAPDDNAARLDKLVARMRPWVRLFGLSLGCLVFGLVVFSPYERAVTVSGRSEVIAAEVDGGDFSTWSFDDAMVVDAAGAETAAQTVSVELVAKTSVRFVRRGNGALLIGFTAATRSQDGCNRVGSVAAGDVTAVPLCEDVRIRIMPTGVPLVVSVRGMVTAGEEVRAGAGPQPVLLDGSAQLLVRHGGAVFRLLCGALPNLCERFAAGRSELSLGDSLSFSREHGEVEATGFIRLDPADMAGGLRFDLAAANAGLEVRRMKGDKFELSESLFERIAKSPVLQALNVTLAALGLIWWFVRAPGEARSGGGDLAAMMALAVSLALPSPARAQQALLKAGETGQALLRSRADRCYAITPEHVMGGESAASLTLERRAQADAEMLRLVPAAPQRMALLLTRAVPVGTCPAFSATPALDGLLRTRAGAVLRLMRPDGSFDRVPLLMLSVDVETFELRPQDPGETLAQGMSGGTVLVDDEPAGLLTDVRDDGHVGRAARLDRVFERLQPYLGSGLASASIAAPNPVTTDTAGLVVVRWTAEPVSLANRADGLLTEGGQPWRVSERTASVIFQLGPNRTVMTGVSIDAGRLPDPPRTVEILLGSSERGPWRSVASMALEPGDSLRQLAIAPTRAAFVLVRASDHQQGQTTMALSRFGLTTRAP